MLKVRLILCAIRYVWWYLPTYYVRAVIMYDVMYSVYRRIPRISPCSRISPGQVRTSRTFFVQAHGPRSHHVSFLFFCTFQHNHLLFLFAQLFSAMYFSLPLYFSIAQLWCRRISPRKCPCETDKPMSLSAGFSGICCVTCVWLVSVILCICMYSICYFRA